MKKTLLLITLSLSCIVTCFAQDNDSSAQIITILNRAEGYIKQIRTISYFSAYRSVYSGSDDSISTTSGQIWMKEVQSDSIFKSTFHIKGETMGGLSYDYFYDGMSSCEVQHQDKKILLINPHLFPNDEHNRAKARTAMMPFNYYFADTSLKQHLLTGTRN